MPVKHSSPEVLVIDDLRIFNFRCVYARTVPDAFRLLFSQPWREIWLDFDMGGDVTTARLARMLEHLALEGHPPSIGRLVVHTSNPPAGDALMAALRAYHPVRVEASKYLSPRKSADRSGLS